VVEDQSTPPLDKAATTLYGKEIAEAAFYRRGAVALLDADGEIMLPSGSISPSSPDPWSPAGTAFCLLRQNNGSRDCRCGLRSMLAPEFPLREPADFRPGRWPCLSGQSGEPRSLAALRYCAGKVI